MRHQYTPVFREFTTSSMWAEPPATRCVWLWLMLHADPEGFVPGTIPGLSVAANVSLAETREAIDKFMAPDPDSNTQENEGRRLEKVPHGWRILNFEYWRELAKREAEKARKRRWFNANAKRGKQLQLPFPPEFLPPSESVESSTDLDASSETIDAPKPKPKPKPKPSSSEGGSPLPPQCVHQLVGRTCQLCGIDYADLPPGSTAFVMPHHDERLASTRVRRVVFSLDGWEPSKELANGAVMAGVQKFDEHIARLRTGPIGGTRGVFEDELDAYIESMFGKWRTWEETDRAKDAQRAAAPAPSSRFAPKSAPPDPFEPEPRQEAFARKYGLDIEALLKGVLDDYPLPSPTLSRRDVLSERLTVAAKQKRGGFPVTGKLTREQVAQWGPVPAGGAIPEVA